MKNTDRFLMGIVAGVLLLVAITFVVTLRQPLPSYQAEDSPEGVAQNYLLALQQADFGRAYRYLAPEVPGYPADVTIFTADVTNDRWAFRLDDDASLEIASSTLADDKAAVIIRETRFEGGGLFGIGQTVSTFTVRLRRANDTWLITDAGAYWSWCWNDVKGCPAAP